MNTKLTILLAAAAGFIGGVLSHFVTPFPVHAQATAQQEIRAQRFLVVDNNGDVLGAFGAEVNGTAQVEVKDPTGHVHWYARSPYDQNGAPKKPTLLR